MASYRKAINKTQVQVSEELGISQQTLAHYEVGRLRVSVETLVHLAHILEVNVEHLIEGETPHNITKRGPVSLLHKQIEQVSQLPRSKQKFVSEMLSTVIQAGC